MVKAVFFDFDGVLSNSKKVHDASWLFAVKDILGLEITTLPSDKIAGKSPKLIASTLCKMYGTSEKTEALLDCKNKYLQKNINQIKPLNGVEKIFRLLKSKNIPFGIASNASKHYVKQSITNWNLDVVISYGYEDYTHPKPNPEPYLKLAAYFKILPEDYKNILVFEDSETGLSAALNAQMKTAYVKSHCSVSEEMQKSVDYIFENIGEGVVVII